MIKPGTYAILRTYCEKSPAIAAIQDSLQKSIELLADCFQNGGQLLICGNGGSCADADHIVGELVKNFRMPRPLTPDQSVGLLQQGEIGAVLTRHLQAGLPAVNLGAHSALISALGNDVGWEFAFAQQVLAYGRPGDILLGISTSGNSPNVRYAGAVARAKGMFTLGLTGRSGGKMAEEFALVLRVDADSTEDVQDLHSMIYHAICAALEYQFWGE